MKLNDLVNKVASDNKTIILSIIIFLIIVYLDFSFIMQSQITANKNIGLKIKALKKDTEKFRKEFADFQEQKNKQKGQANNKMAKLKVLIAEGDIPDLIKEISDLANKNQIRIDQIKPTKEAKDTKQPKAEKFESIKLLLDLSADYHNFGSFINDLENGNVFLAVDKFKIAASPNDYFHQNIELTITTNVKK